MNVSQAYDTMLDNKAKAKKTLDDMVFPMMQGEQYTPKQIKEHWDKLGAAIDDITKPFTE